LESTQEKQDRLKSKFKEDPLVLKQFRSHLADYHGSGFDRGHLVPAADIQTSQKAMDDTFYCMLY
jgi:endonuclease G